MRTYPSLLCTAIIVFLSLFVPSGGHAGAASGYEDRLPSANRSVLVSAARQQQVDDQVDWIACLDDNSEVMLVDPLSGQKKTIKDNLNDEMFSGPGWSPDGQQLVITTRGGDRSTIPRPLDLAILDWSTQRWRLVGLNRGPGKPVEGVALAGPAWSADGSWIYYSYTSDGLYRRWNLRRVSASGAGLEETPPVSQNYYRELAPAFSPNGRWMSLGLMVKDGIGLSNEDRPTNWGIWLTDGAASQPGVRLGGSSQYGSTWSPDSKTVVYPEDKALVLMDVSTRGSRRITIDPGQPRGATWSPDGTRIAFDMEVNGAVETWVVNTDGSSLHKLANCANPAWRPLGGVPAAQQPAVTVSEVVAPAPAPVQPAAQEPPPQMCFTPQLRHFEDHKGCCAEVVGLVLNTKDQPMRLPGAVVRIEGPEATDKYVREFAVAGDGGYEVTALSVNEYTIWLKRGDIPVKKYQVKFTDPQRIRAVVDFHQVPCPARPTSVPTPTATSSPVPSPTLSPTPLPTLTPSSVPPTVTATSSPPTDNIAGIVASAGSPADPIASPTPMPASTRPLMNDALGRTISAWYGWALYLLLAVAIGMIALVTYDARAHRRAVLGWPMAVAAPTLGILPSLIIGLTNPGITKAITDPGVSAEFLRPLVTWFLVGLFAAMLVIALGSVYIFTMMGRSPDEGGSIGLGQAKGRGLANAWLVESDSNRIYRLNTGNTRVGRDPNLNDITLDYPTVSREHILVRADADRFTLYDRGSRGGTWVNDNRVQGPVALNHGDVVILGEVTLEFVAEKDGREGE